MKLNLFVTLLSCVYTYYTNAQGQASVYFCRTGGTDGVYEIRTHSASIGMSVPGTYLVFKGEPGTYTFTAQIAGMENSITMELHEGQNYFVETIVKFKQEKRVPSFREFSLKEARTALNRMEKGLGEKLLTEIYNSAPQDDPAIVYFYRNDDSSVDIPFEIKTDSASIGVSVPKTYIAYTGKPGTEVFKAQIAGRERSKTIDLKAGLTYFIRCYTFEEGGARYPGFQQVGKEKAMQDLNRIEPMLGSKLVREQLIETNLEEVKHIGTQFGVKIKVEYFRYNKMKISDEVIIHFYGEDDTLKIGDLAELKPKTFSQQMFFGHSPYQWLFVKKEPSVLQRQDTSVAILKDGIRIGENLYHIKKERTISIGITSRVTILC